MTIVAGFKCKDGVVLCADMEEGGDGAKVSVEKLIEYNREWCQAGFGGSGNNAVIIGSVINQIMEVLDEKQHKDLNKTRRTIRTTLETIYREGRAIALHPDEYREKKVDLLIAVRPKNERAVALLRADGPALETLQEQDVIGAGDIIRYVSHSLYKRDISINQGVLLGTHLVRLAKKHVPGCGGPTRALIVTSEGKLQLERPTDIERQEQFFDEFNESINQITLLCADTNVDNEDVFQELAATFERIKQTRERYNQDVFRAEVIRSIRDADGYQSDVNKKIGLGTTNYLDAELQKELWRINQEQQERTETPEDES